MLDTQVVITKSRCNGVGPGARELRERGHDVLAVADHFGWVALSDPEVMALARTERRAVVKAASRLEARGPGSGPGLLALLG